MKNITKHILYTIVLLASLSFLSSCEGKLKIEPAQSLSPDVALSSAANVQKLLIAEYSEAGDRTLYGGRLNLASELLANDGELSWQGTYIQPRQYNDKAITTTNSFVRDAWLTAYNVNNMSNIILANLDKFTDKSEHDRVEGEAKFLRGLVYFDLVRFFALPYNAGSVNSQLGVPLVLNPVTAIDQVSTPGRNTVGEVYKQVVSDLTDAYSLLPAKNGVYADKYAAQALLSRVYLQQGNFSSARDASNDVILHSGYSLAGSVSKAFNNDKNSPEDIFAWQVTSQDGINDMNTFWADVAHGGRGDVSVTSKYFSLYTGGGNDDRATFFYGNNFTTKWQSMYANVPFLRLAEMYLIRAETNERLGTSVGDSPLNDINILRLRAHAVPLSTVDLNTILLERRKELAFEGFRLHDIRRLKESVGALNYNANALVFPIPQREIDVNPNLVQNPGY